MADDKPHRKVIPHLEKVESYPNKDHYSPNDKFAEEEPDFLKELPEWHKVYFSDEKKIYRPESEYMLSHAHAAIKRVDRIMGIFDLCLLLYPYPTCWGVRKHFKNSIGLAISQNGFQLVSADYKPLFDMEWRHCHIYRVDLESAEDAAERGWFGRFSDHIPIWRQYVDEKEKTSKIRHHKITQQFREKAQLSSTEAPESECVNTPDGLNIPWQMREIKRDRGRASVLEYAYKKFRKTAGRNPTKMELLEYLTPGNIPDIAEREGDLLTFTDGGTWQKKHFSTAYKTWFDEGS